MADSIKIIETEDGSSTVFSEKFQSSYHSTHGSIQESQHVFIVSGIVHFLNHNNKHKKLKILEMGFGTGLNALLTFQYNKEIEKQIVYTTIEQFPLNDAIVQALNFQLETSLDLDFFNQLHQVAWNVHVDLADNFSINKLLGNILDLELPKGQDIIFYDAFGPAAQKELWTAELMKKLYDSLNEFGVLVTYCAQGQFKRNLKAAGFIVESIPGPPGKREMTRAIKQPNL